MSSADAVVYLHMRFVVCNDLPMVLYCTSFWIKTSAKCIAVIVNVCGWLVVKMQEFVLGFEAMTHQTDIKELRPIKANCVVASPCIHLV